MLGLLLPYSLLRCRRLKSVLCVGCAALLISLTAVFISCFSDHFAVVMQHQISQRADGVVGGIDRVSLCIRSIRSVVSADIDEL